MGFLVLPICHLDTQMILSGVWLALNLELVAFDGCEIGEIGWIVGYGGNAIKASEVLREGDLIDDDTGDDVDSDLKCDNGKREE